MAPSDHTGRITLHRVPRALLVTMLTAIASVLVHAFGLGEKLAGVELAMYVERGLELIVALSAYFGWSRLAGALKDPQQSVID